MLNVKLDTRIPDVNECIQILDYNTEEFGIPLDYDRMCEYYGYYTLQAERLKNKNSRYVDFSQEGSFRLFLEKNKIYTGLLTTPRGGVSLSEESLNGAINSKLYNEDLCQIMRDYAAYKSYLHNVSPFKEILANHDISPIPTYDNHRMIICKPIWTPQNTGRIGMSNPGLMNIAKDLHDIETVPKGWVYLTVDSGQIDPRITQSYYLHDEQLKKCTMMYNDAYYGYIHYCTLLTPEQRASKTTDLIPAEITDEMVARRKKFKTYGNAVMYGSTSNPDGDPLKAAFIKYIGGHPQRVEWQRRVTKQIEQGERIFKTAFGFPIDITGGPSDSNYENKNSDSYIAHLVRCAINNPVQGTAADLMRLSIKTAQDILLRQCKHSYILRYTHDSGTFAIDEDEFDKVAEQLKGITSYQVEDWIPIYGDPQIGIESISGLERFVV